MPDKVVVSMQRVPRLDAASRKILTAYRKQLTRPPKVIKKFVLDIGKLQVGGTVAFCKCKCSGTNDCGGGGGGS